MLTLGRHQCVHALASLYWAGRSNKRRVELSFILGLARRLYPDGSMQPILIYILWRTMEYHPIARLSSASLAHIWLAASGELGDHPQGELSLPATTGFLVMPLSAFLRRRPDRLPLQRIL